MTTFATRNFSLDGVEIAANSDLSRRNPPISEGEIENLRHAGLVGPRARSETPAPTKRPAAPKKRSASKRSTKPAAPAAPPAPAPEPSGDAPAEPSGE